ncbi:MAG: ABC transporter permease [Anaerolineae bacterium]
MADTSVDLRVNPPDTVWRSILRFFYRHPYITLIFLLALPLLWMLVIYFNSILQMVLISFYSTDSLTGRIVPKFSLASYQMLLQPANIDIILRSVAMAATVTIAAAIVSFPISYYIARYARGRTKVLFFLGVMLPLWSSYLVRVYAWKLILSNEGILSWLFAQLGLTGVLDAILSVPGIGGSSLSTSYIGMFVVFLYIWLPYMILPTQAALERVPKSYLEASADMGARPGTTLRKIILPLAFPGVVAGSIFTFSLTLGDYIIPGIIGNSAYFIGSAVYTFYGTAGTFPLAAAFTVVPMAIMGVYLLIARKLGAFDAL